LYIPGPSRILSPLFTKENIVTGKENSKEGKTAKRVISNLVRGGLLAIPYAGPFLEKIIFGPLDDKARDEDRRQLMDCLSKLGADVRFAQADFKDQLAMLSDEMRAKNSELADRIKALNPVNIQQLIIQEVKPIIINVFLKMSPEEVLAVSQMVGMAPAYVLLGETHDRIGAWLFDATAREGSLSSFIAKIVENYPSVAEELTESAPLSYLQELKSRLTEASQPLLRWPTTLGNNLWLHRGELDLLEERLGGKKQSAHLLLGKPGTGKSAILAILCKRLIEKEVVVLAIKADMLPKWINNSDDLQKHLHLPSSVVKCLGIISRSEPIVLIIDQLDAISEFVDRSSERLNLLLDLIQIASGMQGVHVVSSCRWFEYQHDIRLTTIEAERISLEPPIWEDIKTVLKDAGFPQEHWSDEARSLLSVPLHLKILLDLKSRDPEARVPSSLQGLLESIWQQRVVSGESGSNKLSFLDLLCKKMSEEEELWLPRAVADEYAHVFNELQQMNILQTDPLGLQIGFVHQTYFDFARSRAFARGQERLSEYAIQRQDGLFIRPVLLSTLDYLRGASPTTYEREVRSLWDNEGLRPHLKNLLIEYMGSVEIPNDTEVSCLLPMFKEREQGYKVLLAMAGSPGWFFIIKDIYLSTLMSRGPEFAHFIIPVLSRAFSFAKDEVGKIVKERWLPDRKYDECVLMLYSYLGDWDETSVEMICEVAKRHESHWISQIADLVSQSKPDLTLRIVRSDFNRRLEEAMRKEAESVRPPPLSPDASDEEKAIYHLHTRKGEEIERLLTQDKGWHELSQIVLGAPKAFLDCLWPWFLSVVERIAYDPHPFVTAYQEDHSLGTLDDRDGGVSDQPVSALHDAIVALSEKEPDVFLAFFNENIESPYMAVHRLLCTGLLKLAASHTDVILDYLTSDPRRLAVGDSFDCHKVSCRLIAAVVPHLDEKGRRKLENTVVNWGRYYTEDPHWSPEERFRRIKWNREHRLRLLRSFPEEYLSEKTRQLRNKEERALPDVPDWDSRIEGGDWVGSPMSHEQMVKAKDEHILNLFEELDDSTEWNHPRRRWDFIGGSIQASREFAKLAEQDPERVAKLLPHFEPGRQERPAAMAIDGLEKSSFPSERLFKLVGDLVEKGHSSFEFRRDVARALENRAKRDKGLPDSMLRLLEGWLIEDPHPSLQENGDEQEKEKIGKSILWGYQFSFSLPGGRDVYIRALANGYLLREPPEYEGFAKVIESRLQKEAHPEIWKTSLHSMSFLFRWNREKAASYFDYVITNFKRVRESRMGALEIGRVLNLIPEQGTIEKWLTLFRESASAFSQQAFGELLMPRLLGKPEDIWARSQIEAALSNSQAVETHRGLAFAASHNWNYLAGQDLYTEVLIKLSNSEDDVVQEAVSQVFGYGEKIVLNKNMKMIIEAILPQDQVLLKSADKLIEGIMEQVAAEPEIIGRICNRVVEAGKTKIRNISSRLALTAESIVSIALTLHRKPQPFRTIGLELFEKLIDSNIPHARQALDILDRKPVTAYGSRPMRLRRRRERKS
jgi:hypothetical protein